MVPQSEISPSYQRDWREKRITKWSMNGGENMEAQEKQCLG
jgi:hypothetical protein